MNIEKIIKQKNNKYKIIFSDFELITYDDVIINNKLLYKKSISNDGYNKLVNETNYYNIYYMCIKYINKKIRSEKEIRDYLISISLDESINNKILNKLKNNSLVNDKMFVSAFVNDKVYLNKFGINKIKNQLIENNIDINIIEDELNKIDKNVIYKHLEKLIIKKIRCNKNHSNYQLKEKILSDMLLLGYNKSDIIDIINSNILDENKILIKQYNSIKNKNKLEQSKIIKKLLSKGFNYEDIISVIKKSEINF